jgi:hypothetical protein
MSSKKIGAITSVTQAIARNNQPKRPRWSGEKLDEDVARQLPLQILAHSVRDLAPWIVQRLMVTLPLLGQHDQMHERVSVHD